MNKSQPVKKLPLISIISKHQTVTAHHFVVVHMKNPDQDMFTLFYCFKKNLRS